MSQAAFYFQVQLTQAQFDATFEFVVPCLQKQSNESKILKI
jgi:hypothetical protein